jgi:hypothetical protein
MIRRLTTLEAIRLATTASFRPMERNDFMGYAGAEDGAQICDAHPDFDGVIIASPEGGEMDGAISFIQADEEGACEQFDLRLDGR